MTLQELADFLGTEIEVKYQHFQNKRMYCYLRDVWIIDGSLMSGNMGNSFNLQPEKAIQNYVDQIKGKQIKFKDQYFDVPQTLSV